MLVRYPSIYCYILVLAPPRSLATTYGITFVFFSCRYLDVSVPYVSPYYTTFSCNDIQTFTLDEFPHSDICGSQTICVSPQLFAACHVLHRLLIPRHSPYALISLTFYLSILFFLDSLYSSLSIFDYPKSHLYLNYSLVQFLVLYFRYLLPLFCLSRYLSLSFIIQFSMYNFQSLNRP